MACRKRYVEELGKPRWAPVMGTALERYTGIEAMKGKPENGTRLKPTLVRESPESGGGEGLLTGSSPIGPRGVLSGIVLRGGESPLPGVGPDGSTQPSKETYAGRVGPGQHKPTSLEGIAKRARSCRDHRFRDLDRLLNVDLLRECWHDLNKDAASGVDGVTAEAYQEDLEANLEDLVELDAYHQAMAAEQQAAQALDQAQRQQLERLRYQAAWAERQFNHVDPDHRLVAVELERRWQEALRELKQAEAAYDKVQQVPSPAQDVPAELKTAFIAIGQKLPQLWPTDVLSQIQKKALLRCLIDKVVVHRLQRDQIRTRIVWKGGDTTTLDLPIAVGSLAELSHGTELEYRILALAHQGLDDETMAQRLTAEGFRSPMSPTAVLPNTVRCTRFKHHVLLNRCQSHPRQIPGYLTVTPLAHALGCSVH